MENDYIKMDEIWANFSSLWLCCGNACGKKRKMQKKSWNWAPIAIILVPTSCSYTAISTPLKHYDYHVQIVST